MKFNEFFRDKIGGKIISVYWFAILAIVAGGIFTMVYIFYGSPYDVRETEANILINRIADCVSYAGRINVTLISNGEVTWKIDGDFLKDCHLIFGSSEWEDEQYYTEINFYKLGDLDNPVLNITAGNKKWVAGCAIQEKKEQERLAKCVKKSFYSLDDSGNQYIIKILAIVRKSEKNVKL